MRGNHPGSLSYLTRAVVEHHLSFGPGGVAQRHHRDAAIGLENTQLHVLDGSDAVLAHRHLNLLLGDAFAFHYARQIFAVLDYHRRFGPKEVMETGYPIQARDRAIHQHEGNDEHQAATDRGIRPRDGGLQSVGDKQDEDEVVEGELPDLTLAKDPKGDEQRHINEHRTDDQFPPVDGRQDRRRWLRSLASSGSEPRDREGRSTALGRCSPPWAASFSAWPGPPSPERAGGACVAFRQPECAGACRCRCRTAPTG